MSTYAPGPPPPQQPQQPPTKKTSKWLLAVLIVVGLLALLIFGSCVAGLASLGSSAPSVTPVDDSSSIEASTETSSEPAPSTTKPAAPTRSKANIEKSDIKLHVKILSKKCYGYGFGCNVTYRVVVDGAHMSDWPKEGDVEVSYKVVGLEDGPEEDSFMITLDDGQYEKPWEEVSSTRSRGTKLSVKVTDVEFSE